MSRALIVVDVQRDFCEDGALPVNGGHAVAAAVAELLHAHTSAPGRWDAVVATRDHHIDPGSHFAAEPDFVDSWPPHCVVGTPGVEFDDHLTWRKFDAVFNKGEFSAAYSGFEGRCGATVAERTVVGGTGLADWLRERGITAVDVVGIATDYCVNATVLDAVAAGFATTAWPDLTAAVHPGGVADIVAGWASAEVTVEPGRP